jgi:hypothetical protein
VLTESRRRTCKSSGGSGRLGGRAVKDGGDTRRVTETRMECATRGRFDGLGLKTRTEVPRRNVRHVAASRSLRPDETIS